MNNSMKELNIVFLDPLLEEDANRIRSFHAQLKQHPELSKPDLLSDPEFLFVADEFIRQGSRKVLYALLNRDEKPVSMIPIEFGPEKNLPGEYISLFRHPTKLSGTGVCCPATEIQASLAATLQEIQQLRPKAVGFSLIGLDTASALHSELLTLLHDCPTLKREPKIQYCIDLKDYSSIEDYYNSRSKNYKKQVRSSRNRLSKSGEYSYSGKGPQGQWTFDEVARLDAMTWRADEKEGETPKLLLRMCERLAALADVPENSKLSALVLNEEPISMIYSLRVGDITYGFKSTFNPEFAYFSPGMVSFYHFIQYGIESGSQRIELLSGNSFFQPLANQERYLSDEIVFFKNSRSRAAHLAVTSTRKMRDIAAFASTKLAKNDPSEN